MILRFCSDSSSGSYLEKSLVPVPVPVPASVPVPDLFCTVFQQQKICTKSCFLSMLETALFPKKVASNFCFLTFLLHFVGSGSKSGSGQDPEPECITVPVPLRKKVPVPVPAPVP
jgi:hypothetical protein